MSVCVVIALDMTYPSSFMHVCIISKLSAAMDSVNSQFELDFDPWIGKDKGFGYIFKGYLLKNSEIFS